MDRPVCRFYQLNRCVFGDQCRFIHDKNQIQSCKRCIIGQCYFDDKCPIRPPPAVKSALECAAYYEGRCDRLDLYCPFQHSRPTDFHHRLLCYRGRKSVDNYRYVSLYSSDGVRFYTSSNAKESKYVRYPPIHAKKVFGRYVVMCRLMTILTGLDLLPEINDVIKRFLYRLMSKS